MAFKKNNIPWNLGKKYKNPKISLFNKGKHYSVKTEIKKGQRLSPKTEFQEGQRSSINTEFKKGFIPWNKGLKGINAGEKHYNFGKKRPGIGGTPKGTVSYWRGKKRPEIAGENNPAWKGGITPINKALRQSFEYEEWRKSVFERDLYTCQDCGQIGGYLHADHIKRFAEYPDLRFEVSNGQTLCINCHKIKTREEGRLYWKNQFSET